MLYYPTIDRKYTQIQQQKQKNTHKKTPTNQVSDSWA